MMRCDVIMVRGLNILAPKLFLLWVICLGEQCEHKVAGLFMYRSSEVGEFASRLSVWMLPAVGLWHSVQQSETSLLCRSSLIRSSLLSWISTRRSWHNRLTVTPGFNAGTRRGCGFSNLTSSWIYNYSDPSKRVAVTLERRDVRKCHSGLHLHGAEFDFLVFSIKAVPIAPGR